MLTNPKADDTISGMEISIKHFILWLQTPQNTLLVKNTGILFGHFYPHGFISEYYLPWTDEELKHTNNGFAPDVRL